MLVRPALQDELLVDCIHQAYGLEIVQVAFLPLGADRNTAVYRVSARDETPYFCKLRRGAFDELSVQLPKALCDQGIAPIIEPLKAQSGELKASLQGWAVILYPFVEGHNAYEVPLSDHAWSVFGRALKQIHTASLPPALVQHIRQETYPSQWRDAVRSFVERAGDAADDDPLAKRLASCLATNRSTILDLVARAERFAQVLWARPLALTLCHSDLHAGNLLITGDDTLYIVDWDDPILAPRERDLMYIGGGLMGNWHTPDEEEALFYPAYGETQVDPVALAYYRYERIIEDIAVFCDKILLTNDDNKDRAQSLLYLESNFLPKGVIGIAYGSDQTRVER